MPNWIPNHEKLFTFVAFHARVFMLFFPLSQLNSSYQMLFISVVTSSAFKIFSSVCFFKLKMLYSLFCVCVFHFLRIRLFLEVVYIYCLRFKVSSTLDILINAFFKKLCYLNCQFLYRVQASDHSEFDIPYLL